MAHTYSLHPEHQLGVVRLFERVTWDDIERAARALYTDPAWRPPYSTVWDFRGVSALVVLPDDVEQSAALFRWVHTRVSAPGRSAFLARREEDHLIAELLVYLRRKHIEREARVFCCTARATTRDAAAWLGVPEELLAVMRHSRAA
jgi:hypothetical protein